MRAGFVSRGTASTVVPFSPETIGRHERGDVEMEPEDALVYAECYQSPDILPRYCATCPVGRAIGRTATDRPLPMRRSGSGGSSRTVKTWPTAWRKSPLTA